jgi:hypothetical protein
VATAALRAACGYKPRGYKDAEIDSLLKKG